MILLPWAMTPRRPSSCGVILLDRDGVVVDLDDRYVISASGVHLIAGVPDAVRQLHEAGFRIHIVTNQSGIAKRLVSETRAIEIHEQVLSSIDPDQQYIEYTVMCPHAARDGCVCRKPAVDGLRSASAHLGPLTEGWFIGDQLSDLLCGETLGLKTGLVMTGHGQVTKHHLGVLRTPPQTGRDLPDLVGKIVRGDNADHSGHGGVDHRER